MKNALKTIFVISLFATTAQAAIVDSFDLNVSNSTGTNSNMVAVPSTVWLFLAGLAIILIRQKNIASHNQQSNPPLSIQI